MNEVEEIKRRIDIVELISSYLTLKKAGANYKALCPFHQEKTPSFMVSPEKQIWHCFGGCSEGGDIFTFVMKMENLEFPEALKILAARAGVQLRRKAVFDFQKQDEIKKSRLFELNNLVARAFNKILISHPAGRPALEYLKKRQIETDTIKEFMLGYAPSSRAMLAFLKKQKFTDSELQAVGNPERFFQRIIFPIKDVMGNVIAFTGRVLDPKQEPKYLNTPETAIFHKSRVLYNLDKARVEIKMQSATVVVEGQMDVILSFQSGVKNVVATSGTAITPDHLQILYRYSPNIIFAFDSDSAGLKSAKKAYEMAIGESFNVKMVDLGSPPAGGFKDPGEMAAHSPQIWQAAVEKAIPVIDWYFNLAFGEKFSISNSQFSNNLTSQEKKEIAKEILPIVNKIPDTIEQAHYVGLLAKKLNVSEQVIFDALKKAAAKPKGTVPFKGTVPETPARQNLTAPELILAILLTAPTKLKTAQGQIEETDFEDGNLLAIYKALLKRYNLTKASLKSQDEQKVFLDKIKENLNRQQTLRLDDLLLVVSYEKTETLEADFEAVLKNLKENRRENLKDYYAQEIKKAEAGRDIKRLKTLIKEFQDAISK